MAPEEIRCRPAVHRLANDLTRPATGPVRAAVVDFTQAAGIPPVTAGHLQIVVCAAGPASDVATLIDAAHEQSWTTAVTATPHATDSSTYRPSRS